MCVYLHTKFQVSSKILTSFRQGVILPPPTLKRTPKEPTQIRVKNLKESNKKYKNIVTNKKTSCSRIDAFGNSSFSG